MGAISKDWCLESGRLIVEVELDRMVRMGKRIASRTTPTLYPGNGYDGRCVEACPGGRALDIKGEVLILFPGDLSIVLQPSVWITKLQPCQAFDIKEKCGGGP